MAAMAMVTAAVMAASMPPAMMSAAVAAVKSAMEASATAAMNDAAVEAAANAASAPAVPTFGAAPAEPSTVRIAAPVEARALPAAGVEAEVAAAENELRLFDLRHMRERLARAQNAVADRRFRGARCAERQRRR
jgi:hypothetical protein